MQWEFRGPKGQVTVRQDGKQAVFRACRSCDGDGLYKAWLRGEQGRTLLGTLIPEGDGCLRLRRTIPVSQLERQGCWPPVGGEVVLDRYLGRVQAGPPEPGMKPFRPEEMVVTHDAVLRRCLEESGPGGWIEQSEAGSRIVLPFDVQAVFPIPPLLCLSEVLVRDHRSYCTFFFDSEGVPVLPNDYFRMSGKIFEENV